MSKIEEIVIEPNTLTVRFYFQDKSKNEKILNIWRNKRQNSKGIKKLHC